MVLSGFLFLSWRIFEVLITVPIVGILGWIVHTYVRDAILAPNYVLLMFIVSVLALAWTVFTVLSYLRARHDAVFVALVDLGFMAAFIAGVVLLRGWGRAHCGAFDFTITPSGIRGGKFCTLLKASFALGIIDIISFFVTFCLALLVAHHHRNDDRVVVKREYHNSRHGHRRSGSRDVRGSRPRSSGRSQHSSRRNYYV